MKKIFLTFLCLLFIASPLNAAQRVTLVNGEDEEISTAAGVLTVGGAVTNAGTFAVQETHTTTTATPVNAVTLDDNPTSYTSAAVDIGGYQRVGFYWNYDETEVGGVSSTLTLTASTTSGGTYLAIPFFDTAGGATPQTSEALTADGNYICWLDKNIPFGFIKVVITGGTTDADDTTLNTVTMIYDK